MDYRLILSEKDIDMIIAALGELPAKLTVKTINNINTQISNQIKRSAKEDKK